MVNRPGNIIDNDDGTMRIFWEGILNTDDGAAVAIPAGYRPRSFQATGTPNTATLTVEGSNDGTVFANLPTTIAWANTTGLRSIAVIDRYRQYRLIQSSDGASTDFDVTLFLTRE